MNNSNNFLFAHVKGLFFSWENIYREHRSCSRAKCGMSEIGVDIIGTLFSADYIGESKHAENTVCVHASDRRTGRVSYDRFPVPSRQLRRYTCVETSNFSNARFLIVFAYTFLVTYISIQITPLNSRNSKFVLPIEN